MLDSDDIEYEYLKQYCDMKAERLHCKYLIQKSSPEYVVTTLDGKRHTYGSYHVIFGRFMGIDTRRKHILDAYYHGIIGRKFFNWTNGGYFIALRGNKKPNGMHPTYKHYDGKGERRAIIEYLWYWRDAKNLDFMPEKELRARFHTPISRKYPEK